MPLNDGVGLYDQVGQVLFVLNVGAAAIWSRCDGGSSVAAMVDALAAAHGADGATVAHDVKRTLHELARHGVVTDAAVADFGIRG